MDDEVIPEEHRVGALWSLIAAAEEIKRLRAEVDRLRAELARRGRDDVPRIRSDWRVPPFGAEEREIAGEV